MSELQGAPLGNQLALLFYSLRKETQKLKWLAVVTELGLNPNLLILNRAMFLQYQ